MTAKVPGAINLDADDLTGDMIVKVDATTPRSAQTTLDNLAQFLTDSGIQGDAITNLTTAGDGTLTAAGMLGGVINRTGPTAAFADTVPTAAQLLAAIGADAPVGTSKLIYIVNTVGFVDTVTGVTGVTVAGVATIQPFSTGMFLLTYDANTPAFTLTGLGRMPTVAALPDSKVTTGSAATFAAGDITGARTVNYINTGANATLTTRTAAQMFADIPNCTVGYSYQLLIRVQNAQTATITAADASVTLTGTMTIANTVTRTFNVTFVSAVACTITSMGISAAGA